MVKKTETRKKSAAALDGEVIPPDHDEFDDDGDDEGRGRGKPPHEPTDEMREKVQTLSQAGIKQVVIARLCGLSINTLRKYYMAQLVLGDAQVQAQLGQMAVRMALGAPAVYDESRNVLRAEVLPDKTMLIFMLKARLGFSERVDLNLLRPGEQANENGDEFNTVGISNAERATRIAGLLESARAKRAGRAPNGGRAMGAVPRKSTGSGDK